MSDEVLEEADGSLAQAGRRRLRKMTCVLTYRQSQRKDWLQFHVSLNWLQINVFEVHSLISVFIYFTHYIVELKRSFNINFSSNAAFERPTKFLEFF